MFIVVLIAVIIGIAAGIFIGVLLFRGKVQVYKDVYEKLLGENNYLKETINQKNDLIKNLEIENVKLTAEKNSLEEIKKQQAESFKALQEESKNSFKALASETLKEEKNNLNVRNKEILDPLKDDIVNFKQQVENLKHEQMERHMKLENMFERTHEISQHLIKEAADLSSALKNKKIQGNWGEMILENVLQASGLKEGREYAKQVFFRSENNERRYPDFMITLPHGRKIIIDSKMSIENYKSWAAETDEVKKEEFLSKHVQNIKDHIDKLSSKEYQKLLKQEGLDFTIMFMPIEYAYFIALEKDNSLNEYARKNKVVIATASLIFPVLEIIEGLWMIDKANKSSEEIIKLGEDMHKRVLMFVENMTDLGKAISTVQKKYDDAQNRLTGRMSIIKTAEKLENLGVRHQKSLKESDDVEATTYLTTAVNNSADDDPQATLIYTPPDSPDKK
ncbi:MAG: DNA recombination protein RmuC [Elusimicrobiota bacterium]|jgi:DNA recombination protein RmuC|nr:DNA recombination protein RmuC [Elusimicrobiota bacterium]